MTFLVTLTGCGLISSITFLVSVAVLNPTGCESTSNAMPRAWLLFHVFAGFVHVLFFHDLYPLLEMFSTRCLWTTLDLPLAYLSSTNQAQHQKELARHLVPVNSLDCVGEKIFLTMRFDSGYTLDFSPSSLHGSKVSPLLSVTVLCLSRPCNTDDQPVLLHWTVCLSLLQQILAHQNFPTVCTTYFLRHFRASPGRLRLLRQSNSGRKRLHTLNLELIQLTHL